MKYLIVIALLFNCSLLSAQKTTQTKLLIGIVVDQMRFDYLEKFEPYFTEDGFNKLTSQGFNFSNVNFNFKPTYTGPGHATIFTGVYPKIHGIVGNNWYSRVEKSSVYCVKIKNDSIDLFAPLRLKSKTLGDLIKQNSQAKVYGISLKDRSAILPVGQKADGAYWFNSKLGVWESSNFYKNQSPDWLTNFNKHDFKKDYLSENWYSDSTLNQLSFNWVDQEDRITDNSDNFNYNLSEIYDKRGSDILKSIPQGNQMTLDLALDLIANEGLGEDSILDLLSISFSATDYVGHKFGVESKEVFDTYLQLDQTIADFIEYLDEKLGQENYLLFLTSDHGAGLSRGFLKNNNIQSGYLDVKRIRLSLDSTLDINFGSEDWIETIQNLNVYFTDSIKLKHATKLQEVLAYSKSFLENIEGIRKVVLIDEEQIGSGLEEKAINGIDSERSGDLIMIEQANWNTYSNKGSTHGTPYEYDTHVPLLFYGNGIPQGKSVAPHYIVDVVPTIIHLLGINDIDKHSGGANEYSGGVIEELK